MSWTEHQVRMLAEMGLQVPLTSRRTAAPTPQVAVSADAMPVAVLDAPPAPVASPIEAALIAMPIAVPITTPIGQPVAVPVPAEVARPIAEPLRTRAEGLGWTELREAVAGCTACELCRSRTRTVFGVGSLQAHWMVVGEAPGESEDLCGEPFAGKWGQLLDNMLAAIGLDRREDSGEGSETPSPASRVYLADAVKCRPPSQPTSQNVATCAPWLARQVELLQPKIIIAMGKHAVQSLLGTDEPIGRLRGRVHRWRDVPVIVTFHPSYLMRAPVEKARAWDDLCLARETYDAVAASLTSSA